MTQFGRVSGRRRGQRGLVHRQLRRLVMDQGRRSRRPVEERLASAQRGPHRALNSAEDRVLVPETNLPFGRVDVDVDQLRVDADVQYRHRVPPTFEPALVALLERKHQGPRCDRPAVHREHDPVPRAAADTRLRNDTRHQWKPDDLQHLAGDRRPVHRCAGSATVAIAATRHRAASVDRQLEFDVWMEQGKGSHDVSDGCDLGRV